MPRTLLYTIDYPPQRGGVARYLSAMAAYFGSGLFVVGPGLAKPRWWSAAFDLVARRNDYDTVIVSHLLPIGTGAMVAGLVTRKPYLVIVHGMDIGLAKRHPLKRLLAGTVLRRAKAVVANSRALEREVRADFGVVRSLVVYPTAETQAGISSGTRERVGVRLLTVSRLVARKGHLRVLDALAELRRAHPELQVAYDVIGDGPMHDAIARRVADLGLANVSIRTNVADAELAAAYAAADLLVMPVVRDDADREGFGMVYLEAAAHGVPSVATDMPGVDEAVVDGETGVLVPDGDIAALARAVYGLATDSDRRHRLGNAARTRAATRFVPAVQFAKLKPYL